MHCMFYEVYKRTVIITICYRRQPKHSVILYLYILLLQVNNSSQMVNRIIDNAVTLSAISKEPVISEDNNPEIGEEDIAQCIMSKLFLCHVFLLVCKLTQSGIIRKQDFNLSTRDCSKFISRKITEYFKCNTSKTLTDFNENKTYR